MIELKQIWHSDFNKDFCFKFILFILYMIFIIIIIIYLIYILNRVDLGFLE